MSAREKQLCCSCRLPRAQQNCPVCQEPLCRSCAQRPEPEAFAFKAKVEPILTHPEYCPRCYDAHVVPALNAYLETLEKAKNVGFWPKTYRGHIPVLKKARIEVKVEASPDRDEVLLRLGFMAAEQGFNGLILGEIIARKVHKGNSRGYQTMEWSGHALPAQVDQDKIDRAEFREAHWRVLSHR